jgi:hypothetical protein
MTAWVYPDELSGFNVFWAGLSTEGWQIGCTTNQTAPLKQRPARTP